MNKFNQTFRSISIELAKSLIDRIEKTVLASDVEEGGKFLGRINCNGNKVLIKINTFIDSGPRVSNSSTHLHPDGEYQEALYRVIELFDPDIEHIGTWHSHHCNGLTELSERDVQGYIESVNNKNYNSKFFLAMLITSAKNSTIECRFFLFIKGRSDYFELESNQVNFTQSHYFLEPMLQQAEKVSMLRPQTPPDKLYQNNRNRFPRKTHLPNTKIADSMKSSASISQDDVEKNLIKTIRAEDEKWFKSNFVGVKTIHDKKNNSLCWVWEENIERNKFVVRYEYSLCVEKPMHALLEFRYNNKTEYKTRIEINSSRFPIIQQHYLKMRDKAIKKSGMATYNRLGQYDS